MANLYLYQRVSSAQQLDGHGLSRQTDYIADYLKKHPEHRVVKRYSDDGKSGFKGHNLKSGSDLHSFLKDFEAGLVPAGSILVVENLERVTRQNPMKAVAMYTRLFDAGVIIESLNDGVTYSDENSLPSLILAAVNSHRAHEESLVKSDRIGKAWKEKVELAIKDGKPHGRNCPRWLRLSDDGTKYELIPEKAAVMKRLFELRIAGHGLLEIANMMNDQGTPLMSPQRKNSKGVWHSETVRDLLQSPQAHGDYRGRADYYPAVVSFATFHTVQKTFRKGKGQQIKNIDTASKVSLLKGLCKCAKCKRYLSLTGVKGNHRGNYRCSSCSFSYPALRLERRIIGAALAWIPVNKDADDREHEKETITKEVTALNVQQRALRRSLENVTSDEEADEIEQKIDVRAERCKVLNARLLELSLGNRDGAIQELQDLDWKNSIEQRVQAHQLIKDWLSLAGTGVIIIDGEEDQARIATVGEWDGEPEIVHVYIGEDKQQGQNSEDDSGITDDEFWNSILNG